MCPLTYTALHFRIPCLSQDKESLVKVSMVVTEEEEKLQKATFEVTWTDEESGVAKKAKKVRNSWFLVFVF